MTLETNQSMPPTTTVEEDKVTKGQRRVNIIWEVTQAIIALIVVIANMWVGTYQGLNGESGFVMPPILSNSLFLVIGFYFSRTNHSNVGGVGNKPTEGQVYTGR